MEETNVTDESSDEETFKHDEVISTYTLRDPKDIREFISLDWVQNRLSYDLDEPIVKPPMFLIYYPVLFERWGWETLVPYNSTYSIEWPEFKRYLKDYFSHNAGKVASLCGHHRSDEPIEQGTPPAVCNVLQYAANLCLEIEDTLILRSHLNKKGVKLSCMIKKRAKRMIQSEGDSPAAAAGLVCTMMEAELMLTSLELGLVSTKKIHFSNKIRLSALKLMLCKMNESDAAIAAGALVGMAKEARKICSLLRELRPNNWRKVDMSEEIRRCTAEVLTRLVEEFSCNRAGKTKKPIGVSTVPVVICEGQNSMGNNEHCLRDNDMRVGNTVELIGDNDMKLNSDMTKLRRAQKKRFKRKQKKLKRAEEWRLKNGNETKLSLTITKDKDLEGKSLQMSELTK